MKPFSPATPLQLLQALADPETMEAALPIARGMLKLTPEKLALLIVRLVNPDEIIRQGKEQVLRGVTDKTLRGYKGQHLLPELINGK